MAHGPADIYYLMWWYLALMFVGVGYVILGPNKLLLRMIVVGGGAAFTALGWLLFGGVDMPVNSQSSLALSGLLGLFPVVGVVLVWKVTRNRKK